MPIYPSTKVAPYVYICTNKLTNQFYIGYRELNKIPSHEDFLIYKTSSNVVKLNFNDYSWYILAEFNTGNDAYDFEQQLIYEHWDNPLLLNKSCFFNKQRFKKNIGSTHSKPAWNKGIPQSAESNEKRSAALKDKPTGRKGIPLSDEHKENISKSTRGKLNSGSFGTRPAWNKGLTKETDARIAKYASALSETNKGNIPWNKGISNKGK